MSTEKTKQEFRELVDDIGLGTLVDQAILFRSAPNPELVARLTNAIDQLGSDEVITIMFGENAKALELPEAANELREYEAALQSANDQTRAAAKMLMLDNMIERNSNSLSANFGKAAPKYPKLSGVTRGARVMVESGNVEIQMPSWPDAANKN